LKNPPKVFVKVEKNSKVLDVKLSKLSDGVYSLALDLNDAYGVMNVSVWTKSKPKVSQQFELDFGTPWLKIVSWRKAADSLAQDLQKRWSVATKGATDIQKYVAMAIPNVKMTKAIPKVDKDAYQAVLARAKLASKSITKEVTRRSEVVTKQVLRQSERITKDLIVQANVVTGLVQRHATTFRKAQYAPKVFKLWDDIRNIRPDEQIKKAQLNAKRLLKQKAEQLKKRRAELKTARKTAKKAQKARKAPPRSWRKKSTSGNR